MSFLSYRDWSHSEKAVIRMQFVGTLNDQLRGFYRSSYIGGKMMLRQHAMFIVTQRMVPLVISQLHNLRRPMRVGHSLALMNQVLVLCLVTQY